MGDFRFELGSTPSEILKDSARELALQMHWIRLKSDKMEPILVATMRDILLKAWGTYFTEVSNNIHEYSDPQEIEQEYDEFMEDLEKYFPKDKKNVFEAAGYMASNEQLKMIDELAGEVLKVISFGMQLLPEPVKKVLENRVVQGLAKTSGGLTQIAAGCELCTTVVGSVQGIPMIALGTNMAFEGLQDLWYTLNGELDKESKNLIKEATGHKIDNIVELSEIGMSIYAGKVSSKKIAGKIGEESQKLGGLLKKIKKPVSSLSAKSKRLVKKFLPKRHYRKFEVVDIEELAKKQGLKPNLQLFAEETGVDGYIPPNGGGGITSKILINGKEVVFGHGGRHLTGTKLNVNAVNKKLAEVVSKLKLKKGEFYKGQVKIDDVVIEFTSFGVSDDKINIGTYYPK